jgi:hypothetical protein
MRPRLDASENGVGRDDAAETEIASMRPRLDASENTVPLGWKHAH